MFTYALYIMFNGCKQNTRMDKVFLFAYLYPGVTKSHTGAFLSASATGLASLLWRLSGLQLTSVSDSL